MKIILKALAKNSVWQAVVISHFCGLFYFKFNEDDVP